MGSSSLGRDPRLTARPPAEVSTCLISGEYPPATGGVADYTAHLAHHLQRLGARVTVLTSEFNQPTTPADGGGELELRRVPGWGRRNLDQIVQTIRAIDADVVHLQYQAAAYGMAATVNLLPLILRARGVRSRFVTTFHDLRVPYLFPKAGPLRRLAVHTLVGGSAGSIFTDPGDLARAHPHRAAAWIPMAPTLWPVGEPNRASGRAALGIGDDAEVIAHFGFMNASKGIDTLLRAAERLHRAGRPVWVLFVGEERGASDKTNGAIAERVRDAASDLGIGDYIVKTGHATPGDVSTALAATDLAVLPFVDGASLRRSSLLACFAHGLPVVTTEPRAVPRPPREHAVAPFEDPAAFQIDDRVAALIRTGDDAALARTIYRLLDEPSRAADLGRNGRALAERLCWPAVASATLEFYDRVRTGTPKGAA